MLFKMRCCFKMVEQENAIAIVTLPGRFNYGNRLQNYATSEIYKALGYHSVTLEVQDSPNLKKLIKKILSPLFKSGLPANPEDLMSEGRIQAFNRFNRAIEFNTIRTSDKDLDSSYKFFSVGSDQVWNPGYMYGHEDFYLLDFCSDYKKIALSASIGLDELSEKDASRIVRSVESFKGISVREKRAAEIIGGYSSMSPVVVCDPTVVLTPEEWRAVADGRCTPSEPYVFTYLLGGIGSEASAVLEKVTDHGRIPVVPLTDRQKPGEPDAGPAEFIDLIDHSVHVVTDSFHAAVFSSILQSPLTIVHREGGASMFSRLKQLSEMLGIEEKVYGSPSYDLSRAGDYDGVPEAIARERAHFMEYLEGCLNG